MSILREGLAGPWAITSSVLFFWGARGGYDTRLLFEVYLGSNLFAALSSLLEAYTREAMVPSRFQGQFGVRSESILLEAGHKGRSMSANSVAESTALGSICGHEILIDFCFLWRDKRPDLLAWLTNTNNKCMQ